MSNHTSRDFMPCRARTTASVNEGPEINVHCTLPHGHKEWHQFVEPKGGPPRFVWPGHVGQYGQIARLNPTDQQKRIRGIPLDD